MNFERNEAVSFVTVAEEYIRTVVTPVRPPVGWPGTYWLPKGYDTLIELLKVEPGEHTTKHYSLVATYLSDTIDGLEWEWYLTSGHWEHGTYRAMQYIVDNVVNRHCIFCRGRLVRCKCRCRICNRMIVTQSKGVWYCVNCGIDKDGNKIENTFN